MDYKTDYCVYITNTQQKWRSNSARLTLWEFSSLPSLELSLPLSPLQRETATCSLILMEGCTQEHMVFKVTTKIPLRSGSISRCTRGLTMFTGILSSKHVQAAQTSFGSLCWTFIFAFRGFAISITSCSSSSLQSLDALGSPILSTRKINLKISCLTVASALPFGEVMA